MEKEKIKIDTEIIKDNKNNNIDISNNINPINNDNSNNNKLKSKNYSAKIFNKNGKTIKLQVNQMN